jgi:23S rRNA (adenine-N6)-dimethyltransferase
VLAVASRFLVKAPLARRISHRACAAFSCALSRKGERVKPAQRRSIAYSQNFLRDGRLVDQLIRRSCLRPSDLVYEIGPGRGIITTRLARVCGRVVAVEKDPALACWLQRRFAATENVRIITGDFLEQQPPREPYKVFASIPFNITAAVMTRLTTTSHPPEAAYLALQREAAQRYTGRPVTTLAAVLLQPWFQPRVLYQFNREDFSPPPGVDVVMMRMCKRGPPLVATEHAELFRGLVTYAFTAARPNLGSILLDLFGRRLATHILRTVKLEPATGPSRVPFEQWLTLFRWYREYGRWDTQEQVLNAEQRLRRQQAGLQKSHRTRVGVSHRVPGPRPGTRSVGSGARAR